MRAIGFLLGVVLTITFIIYIKFISFRRHYDNLLCNKTKVKIKLNKSNIMFMLIGDLYKGLPKILEVGLILIVIMLGVNIANIGTIADAITHICAIVGIIICIINVIMLINIVIKQRKLFKNNYYYLEDKISHEQTEVIREEQEFYVHFKKCVVPTEIPVHIADAIKVDDEVYILVLGKKLHVFNKNYFELEEKDKLKEQYIITTNIEGK